MQLRQRKERARRIHIPGLAVQLSFFFFPYFFPPLLKLFFRLVLFFEGEGGMDFNLVSLFVIFVVVFFRS